MTEIMEAYGVWRVLCFWTGAIVLSCSMMLALCLVLAWVHYSISHLLRDFRSRRLLRLLDSGVPTCREKSPSEKALDTNVRRHERLLNLGR